MSIQRKVGGRIFVEYEETEPGPGTPWGLVLLAVIILLAWLGCFV